MLSFVTWLWKPAKGYRSAFCGAHVNTLASMVRRHYPHPHRFLCVTDMPDGIGPEVEIVKAWNDFATVPSPHGTRNPSCYRRLRAFDPHVRDVLGDRVVSMDLDLVITGDLTPLFHRPEEFIILQETDPRSFYNGSLFCLTAGARAKVWTSFDPKRSPKEARQAGRFGSDQGWISHCLGRGEATWGTEDGVYSYRRHLKPKGSELPENARIVNFHGEHDPWDSDMQKLPWVAECYA
jgi:hypothetical protein